MVRWIITASDGRRVGSGGDGGGAGAAALKISAVGAELKPRTASSATRTEIAVYHARSHDEGAVWICEPQIVRHVETPTWVSGASRGLVWASTEVLAVFSTIFAPAIRSIGDCDGVTTDNFGRVDML